MKSVLKEGLLFGLGIATITHESMEKIVKDFAKRNNLSTAEGKKLVEELVDESKKTSKKVFERVQEHAKSLLEKNQTRKQPKNKKK